MAKINIRKVIEAEGFKCDKCGHEWIPRNGKAPKVCPVCKSIKWNEGKGEEK